MLTAIGAIAGLVSLVIHLIQGIARSKAAPAAVSNALGGQIQKMRDQAAADVTSPDLEALRKDVAE